MQQKNHSNNTEKYQYRTRSISNNEHILNHIQQLKHHTLMNELLNPYRNKYSKLQRNKDKNYQGFLSSSINNKSILYPEISMDMTSYSTLKQLIIQNKALKKQSESAYFLSKQSQKLIQFIDGWRQLNRGEQIIINDEVDIHQMKRFHENSKRQSKEKSSKQAYQQQQTLRLKKNLQQQRQNRIKGQEQLKKVQQNIQRKANIQNITKFVKKSALQIKDQQQRLQQIHQQHLQSNQQSEQQQEQLQIQVEISQSSRNHQNNNQNLMNINNNNKENNQNIINNSNDTDVVVAADSMKYAQQITKKQITNKLNKVSDLQNKIEKQVSNDENNDSVKEGKQIKKIKINTKENSKNTIDNKFNNKFNQQNFLLELSEIIRPEYQKTEMSVLSQESSLTQSLKQKDFQNTQNNFIDNKANKMIQKISSKDNVGTSNLNQDTRNKKKVIPLLKKGKHVPSPSNYNELIMQQTKFKNQQLQAQMSTNNKLTYQLKKNQTSQRIIQKGFVSSAQQTDANSRMSTLTNNYRNIKPQDKNKQPDISSSRRSLSPKVQGKKKVIKLINNTVLNQNKINLSENEKQNAMKKSVKSKIINCQAEIKNIQEKYMQKKQQKIDNQIKKSQQDDEMVQLEEQFSSYGQKTQFNNVVFNDQSLQNKRPELKQELIQNQKKPTIKNQYETIQSPSPSRQNKTLKFIKKSSSSVNPSASKIQLQKTFTTTVQQNKIQKNNSYPLHYPLSNQKPNNKDSKRKPNNSIVLQQEPWECDELELEQELKKIDQKIQGRKSVLAARQLSLKEDNLENKNSQIDGGQTNRLSYQTQNHLKHGNNPYHYRTNSVNQDFKNKANNFSTSPNYSPSFNNGHKRSNTTSFPNYPQHLFDQHSKNIANIHLTHHYAQQNHYEEETFNNQHYHHNEPKVVRLSLTQLANQANKKSKNSLTNQHKNSGLNRASSSRQKISLQKQQKTPKNSQNRKTFKQQKVYYHPEKQVEFYERQYEKQNYHQNINEKKNLNKQPSCKSILLFQQAEKRGISPSKSTRSLKSHNKKGISPIKQYIQGNKNYHHNNLNSGQLTPNSKTPRNLNQNNKINLGRHSPSPIIHNNAHYNNRSPAIKRHHQRHNTTNFNQTYNQNTFLSNYQNQNLTPNSLTSNSRTLSDLVDSQYSRAKKHFQNNNRSKSPMNNNINANSNLMYEHKKISLLKQKNGNKNKEANQNMYNYMHENENNSFYSNCEPYFANNQQYEVKYQNKQYAQDNFVNKQSCAKYQGSQNIQFNQPVKKWNLPSNPTGKNASQQQPKKKKIMLLSDQVEN